MEKKKISKTWMYIGTVQGAKKIFNILRETMGNTVSMKQDQVTIKNRTENNSKVLRNKS